ncbi:hypothetical protein PHISP_01899 [Aspergillus sp. HF37]|nr:hypothetical protein PHISP_01899 [Aspergillus sp. HF37]
MSYFIPDLRIRNALGQIQGAVSKSMAHTSRYVSQKIRSGEGEVSVNDNNAPTQRSEKPFKFPRLNETYLLMDVDYLRPQGARPWAPPHSLQVMNPDPDYLDEEYVQVGPSPAEFNEPFSANLATYFQPSADEDEEQEPPVLLSQMSDDGTSCQSDEYSEPPVLEDIQVDPDGEDFTSTCLSSLDFRNWDQRAHPEPPQSTSCQPSSSQDNFILTLCENIQTRPEDAALLAGVIHAGHATQCSRSRRL